MDDGARADRATGIDHHPGIERAVVADADTLADDAAAADGDARAEAGALRHHRRRVNAPLLEHHGIEELREPREVRVRILGDDARQARLAFGFRAEHHRRGVRGGELRAVAAAGEEADVTRGCALERGHLVHERIGVARDPAAEALHDLPERERPRHRG